MLLSTTNSIIVAVEPHPRNQFALQQTISALQDQTLQQRVVLFPIGAGASSSTSTIYAAADNFGNSIVGAQVKDHDNQRFDTSEQHKVYIERLDSILRSSTDIGLSNQLPRIPLMKLDAQGFECNVLEGMNKDLANRVDIVRFEVSNQWLQAQGCTNLLERFRKFGFNIYKGARGDIPLHGEAHEIKAAVKECTARKPKTRA